MGSVTDGRAAGTRRDHGGHERMVFLQHSARVLVLPTRHGLLQARLQLLRVKVKVSARVFSSEGSLRRTATGLQATLGISTPDRHNRAAFSESNPCLLCCLPCQVAMTALCCRLSNVAYESKLPCTTTNLQLDWTAKLCG